MKKDLGDKDLEMVENNEIPFEVKQTRENWTGKFDFFFSALGYAGK